RCFSRSRKAGTRDAVTFITLGRANPTVLRTCRFILDLMADVCIGERILLAISLAARHAAEDGMAERSSIQKSRAKRRGRPAPTGARCRGRTDISASDCRR